MIASVWTSAVDVALGVQAAIVLGLVRAVWRLERRVDRLQELAERLNARWRG